MRPKLTFAFLPVLFLVVGGSCPLAFGQQKKEPTTLRTWTDSTGKHKVEAEFVEFKDGTVCMKTAGGGTRTVPIDRLSREDQEFVRSKTSAKRKEGRPAAKTSSTAESEKEGQKARVADVRDAKVATADPTGNWKGTLCLHGGGTPMEVTLNLKVEGEKVTGVIRGHPIQNASYGDGKLSFAEDLGPASSISVFNPQPGQRRIAAYTAIVSGDTIKGKMELDNFGPRIWDWEASRPPKESDAASANSSSGKTGSNAQETIPGRTSTTPENPQSVRQDAATAPAQGSYHLAVRLTLVFVFVVSNLLIWLRRYIGRAATLVPLLILAIAFYVLTGQLLGSILAQRAHFALLLVPSLIQFLYPFLSRFDIPMQPPAKRDAASLRRRHEEMLYAQGYSTSETKRCSRCGGRLSLSARPGESCPHCGVHFSGQFREDDMDWGTMANNLNAPWEIKCPECGRSVWWPKVRRVGGLSNKTCPHCGTRFRVKNDDVGILGITGYVLAFIVAVVTLCSAWFRLG